MWMILTLLVTTAQPYLAACGRSPIPQPGESITRPLPFVRLQAEEKLSAPAGVVPWGAAHRYVDQQITVEGVIVDTHAMANLTFLNFDRNWQGKFYIVVFADAHEPTFKPDQAYLNRKLRITGKVVLHRDRPQIQVRRIDQIQVVEAP